MGESNTDVSACTMYRHLQQYCSHPSIYIDIYIVLFSHFLVCPIIPGHLPLCCVEFVLLGVLRRINSISVIERRQLASPCFLDYF